MLLALIGCSENIANKRVEPIKPPLDIIFIIQIEENIKELDGMVDNKSENLKINLTTPIFDTNMLYSGKDKSVIDSIGTLFEAITPEMYKHLNVDGEITEEEHESVGDSVIKIHDAITNRMYEYLNANGKITKEEYKSVVDSITTLDNSTINELYGYLNVVDKSTANEFAPLLDSITILDDTTYMDT